MAVCLRRAKRDFEALDTVPGITSGTVVTVDDVNPMQWIVCIAHAYVLRVTAPVEFPFKPPSVELMAPDRHPNVHHDTHSLCLHSITSWAPTTTLGDVVAEATTVMLCPDYTNVADPDAGTNAVEWAVVSKSYGSFTVNPEVPAGCRRFVKE
jgi:ubiquitin-protein ligase